jgi:hypothetical protein
LQFVLHLVVTMDAQPSTASLHDSLQIFASAPRTRTSVADTGFGDAREGDPDPIPHTRSVLGKDQVMALLAVLLPLLMLGVMLALGRYEELLLPREQDEDRRPEGAALGH